MKTIRLVTTLPFLLSCSIPTHQEDFASYWKKVCQNETSSYELRLSPEKEIQLSCDLILVNGEVGIDILSESGVSFYSGNLRKSFYFVTKLPSDRYFVRIDFLKFEGELALAY